MSQTESNTKFQAPFTLEAFRKDIAEVLLHYLRIHAALFGEADAQKIYAAAGLEYHAEGGLFDVAPIFEGDAKAADIFDYGQIKDMVFAQVLERMYEFAYEGKIDSDFDAMEDESCFTFVSAVLVDANQSELLEEWVIRGSWAAHGLKRCLDVAELCNARNILEGGESYFPRFVARSSDAFDGLTIRQMALLAGMEEMSIRAAANPKRANPLKTSSDGRGTFITLADAKEWLQSKGLYVPVTYHHARRSLDLKTRGFANTLELYHLLQDRFQAFAQEHGQESLRKGLSDAVGREVTGIADMTDAEMQNPHMLEKLARLLDLPVMLLQVRVAEVYAEERLRGIRELLDEAIRT